MRGYDVRPREPLLDAHSFSGGNQQKLVLAREMEHDPDLLLVGQPTRGVDIGAIEFIHKRLIAMRDAGKAVLLVSVELDEILSLSDRILVMFDGTITGELSAAEADERRIGLLMAGITQGGGVMSGGAGRHLAAALLAIRSSRSRSAHFTVIVGLQAEPQTGARRRNSGRAAAPSRR